MDIWGILMQKGQLSEGRTGVNPRRVVDTMTLIVPHEPDLLGEDYTSFLMFIK